MEEEVFYSIFLYMPIKLIIKLYIIQKLKIKLLGGDGINLYFLTIFVSYSLNYIC